MSDPPPLGRAAAVVRDGRHVLDAGHLDPGVLQRPDGGLPTGPGALHQDVDLAHALLHGLAGAGLGRQLGRARRGLARAFEADIAGRRPRDDVALHVADGDDRVGERALEVRHPIGHGRALSTAGTTPTRLRFGHYLRTFFLPATVFFGPFRVRALVWVRWPWTGRPRRWRMPW